MGENGALERGVEQRLGKRDKENGTFWVR